MNKPIASLSLDLDDKWAFLKTHGDEGWKDLPSFFPQAVPILLDTLSKTACKITFFIVGIDAKQTHNKQYLEAISEAGHEIGNHTFHHDPWIQSFSKEKVNEELKKAEEAILKATGQKPIGFRGPAFTFSPTLLEVLHDRNYLYDASTLPNILNPISRAFFFFTSNLTQEEKEERKFVFGNIWDGLRPIKAYKWHLEKGKKLLEIPVTTLPIFRFPIHMTYILYLSKYSRKLALSYFKFALKLCKMRGVSLSILLSPTDFLGKEDNHGIPFFPGMNLSREYKIDVVESAIEMLKKDFEVKTMTEHANCLIAENKLKDKIPKR